MLVLVPLGFVPILAISLGMRRLGVLRVSSSEEERGIDALFGIQAYAQVIEQTDKIIEHLSAINGILRSHGYEGSIVGALEAVEAHAFHMAATSAERKRVADVLRAARSSRVGSAAACTASGKSNARGSYSVRSKAESLSTVQLSALEQARGTDPGTSPRPGPKTAHLAGRGGALALADGCRASVSAVSGRVSARTRVSDCRSSIDLVAHGRSSMEDTMLPTLGEVSNLASDKSKASGKLSAADATGKPGELPLDAKGPLATTSAKEAVSASSKRRGLLLAKMEEDAGNAHSSKS